MPNPTKGDVHVNKPLTNISVAFMQKAENFIAARVFPNIPVEKKSDVYFTYDRGSFNRDEMKERAPSTESAGGGYDVSTDDYTAKVYAFHKDIDDQIRSNSDNPLNLDREATEYVSTKGLIKREKLWVSSFFGTGVWTTDITGVSGSPGAGQVKQWNDDASTPIVDVAAGKATILQSTGVEPNKLVLGYQVWQYLKDHPDIVDRIKYSSGNNNPAVVTKEAVAALFEVEEILIMKSIENTAKEGQTASHSFIGGKKALLCYAPPVAGVMTPSAGYTFSWTGYLGAGPMGNRIKKFRMDKLNSDRVEAEMAFALKKVAADLGYFFTSIVA